MSRVAGAREPGTQVGHSTNLLAFTLVVPGVQLGAGVRRLPLPGFEPLAIGAVWREGSSPLVPAFVEVLQKYAKSLPPVS